MSIVRRSGDKISEVKKMFGGAGEVTLTRILNTPEEMSGKGRLYNIVTLEPGAEIGWHVHKGDGETYFILSGTAEYSDNGTPVRLETGDVAVVYDGEGHALKNIGADTLTMMALILYS